MAVTVLDASAWLDMIVQGPASPRIAERLDGVASIYVLDITRMEVLNGLRRLERRAGLDWGDRVPAALRRPPYSTIPTGLFLERVWALRSTHTASDAAYVALAEVLDAPLLTTDRRLARSHGHRAKIIDCSEGG